VRLNPAFLGLVAALALLTGCSALKDLGGVNSEARIFVTYATLKYIGDADDPAGKAAKVRDVAEQVRAAARGESVTIEALKALVMARLPADMDPADRFVAGELVNVLAARLAEGVGDGVLDPEKLVAVDQLIGWVIDATAYYGTA
jgi:hypothetical protein